MKNLKISKVLATTSCAFLLFAFTSCQEAGVTSKYLNGDESNLPDELKGLKVYSVSTGGGTYVKVAVLDGNINSTNYNVGKHQESIVMVNKQNGKRIEVSKILSENDSIIVCRK